jgi:hypothetical protein
MLNFEQKKARLRKRLKGSTPEELYKELKSYGEFESIVEGGYCKGGSCDVTHLYPEDVFKIADSIQCTPLDILFLEHDQEAEVCIYIKGKWCGYLDSVYSYR